MSENWRAGYRAAMVAFVLRNGTVQSEWSPGAYSALYPDYAEGPAIREHLQRCGAKLDALEECSWWDGADTFNDGTERHGVVLVLTCACGEVERRRVRYEGTVGEILFGLLAESDD